MSKTLHLALNASSNPQHLAGPSASPQDAFGLQMLQSFFPQAEAAEAPAVLLKLASQVQSGKSLKEAVSGLEGAERTALQKKVGQARVAEILSLVREKDSQFFWEGVHGMALKARAENQLFPAGNLFTAIVQAGEAAPAEARQKAQAELDAIAGKGHTGRRMEFLTQQFVHQATDAKMIAPMILGSAVFQLTRTAALGRLAATTEASWFTRGFGARLTAGAAGFVVEAPTFALGSKALMSLAGEGTPWDAANVGKELAAASITLGALKTFGFLGNQGFLKFHGIGELQAGQLTRMQRASQFAFAQGAMFTGMMAGHKLEERIGLRPHVEGATAVVDTLSSMVSLGVGGHLGHKVLGKRFAAFQQEIGIRANIYGKALDSAPRSGDKSPVQWLGSVLQGPRLATAGAPMAAMASRPEAEGKRDHVLMMEGREDGGGLPPSPGGRPLGGGEPGFARTWLELAHEKGAMHIKVPESLLPQAKGLWEKRPAELGEKPVEVLGAFLKLVADAKGSKELGESGRLDLLGETLTQFELKALKGNDIHAVTRGLPNQAELLRSYYESKAELFQAGRSDRGQPGRSALFEAAATGRAGLFAQFGGQANTYFGELRFLYQTYPQVRPLVEAAAKALQAQAETPEARAQGFHTEGLDILKWIQKPEAAPGDKYLASSAVSQPLIGLTQLAHYFVAMQVTGRSPAEMRQLFKGATGHSQGVMASVVLASSGTEAEFFGNTEKMVKYLLWQGIRMQQVSPETTLNPDIVRESVAAGDGVPTQMLNFLKLSPETVEKYIKKVNAALPESRRVHVSLVNSPRAVVVSGHPEGLHRLLQAVRKDAAKPGEDQGRVPHSKRKLEFTAQYFPVSAEFHSPYMSRVPAMLRDDMRRIGVDFKAEDLAIPVYNTYHGEDLRKSEDLLTDLILQQSVLPVHWERATAEAHGDKGISHVLDFGPGESVGIGAITARNKEGTGVQVVLAGALQGDRGLGDKSSLFDADPKSVRFAPHWERDFGPKLVRLADGSLMVDTRFTRLLGKPPVMVAGMTPTTANEQLVAAFTKAGFHGELAGGGQHTEAYFRDRVAKIMAEIPAGEGITTNLLFLNAYLWGFQYPLVEVMRQEGKPMDGVTIAAGVPTLETANEVLASLRQSGIQHVSFKPGNIASIKQVIEIAKANPESQIILQWTGGRGGGHHSYEDMHEPILQTYAAMRRLPNLTLVAGSGFGDAKDALPYMTGEWSREFGMPAMPFDAVLVASRVMASREASTSPEAKELIAQAPGIPNEKAWEGSYEGPVGGVRTVVSELGEPIHKLDTRGVALWAKYDAKYFNKAPAEAEAAILADKATIIAELNRDYQKVYFGKKADGRVADLEEMTYMEVARRMVELMHVPGGEGGRWIDVTFRDRVYDFLVRTEERFHRSGDSTAFVQSPKQLEADPVAFLQEFFARYPKAQERLLASEDVDHFLNLAKRPGKPVNFIPVIDKDLKIWFKKDSLWQSEDLRAVPGNDVQRVAILQGPVAVRYTTKANEPIGEILGGINDGMIEVLKVRYPNLEAIPQVEYLGGPKIEKIGGRELPGVNFRVHPSEAEGVVRSTSEIPVGIETLPDAKKWREFLAGNEYSWLRAMLTSPHVVQGKDKQPNPMEGLLRPRPGQTVEVAYDAAKKEPRSLKIFDPMMKMPGIPEGTPAVEIERQESIVVVRINHPKPATAEAPAAVVPLELYYRYNPKQGYSPIHEVMDGKNERIKDFYAQLWFGEAKIDGLQVNQKFTSSYQVTREDARAFTRAIGNRQEAFTDRGQERLQAPLDLAIVAAWEPLIKTIFPKSIDGNIFRLLHLSNGFRVLDPKPFQEGDKIDTAMRILEVRNVEGGKRITVQGTLTRDGKPAVELNSQFFIRGNFIDFQNTFQDVRDRRVVALESPEAVAVLRSKHWFELNEGETLKAGDRLTFDMEHFDQFSDKTRRSSTATVGTVTRDGRAIGSVAYSRHDTVGNEAVAYLERFGKPADATVPLASPRNLLAEADVVTAPKDNQGYAVASRDLNPIHVNPYIADLAELPTTITHGMWTSANGRRVVETHVAKNRPERVVAYEAQFQGMVKPGDTLSTQVRQIGMREGRQVLEVETVNQDGATVLKATAEVEAPKTAYVFTGQGSAEPGMGMELYDSSPVAKAIWDKADAHTRETLGFSILDIVRNNPKELTIHFGGPKGARIRENLRALRQEVVIMEGGERVHKFVRLFPDAPEGSEAAAMVRGEWVVEGAKPVRKTVPLFPQITETSESFTFRSPNGLLFATQFTQPAITMVEMAAYEDMRAKGLIPTEASFAGHSLGEYAGLSTVGKVLPIESVVELVFLRGMTMQGAVPRDAQGRSPYGMIAARPGIIKGFSEDNLRQVAAAIEAKSGKAIEVVNYNVVGTEYVIAGDLVNLEAMGQVLGALLRSPGKLAELDGLVSESLAKAAEKKAAAADGAFGLSKTKVTVPLEGIDVPFHSKVLREGVPAFRNMLEAKMPRDIDVALLEGKYVPNLTAKPYSVDKSYVESVYDQTQSPVLKGVLENWETASKDRNALGRTLLIELLAYQFASPVRWIETQDHLFGNGVERLIEVGPNVTLANMAKRTLGGEKYQGAAPREILSYKADREEIYFEGGDAAPAAPVAKKAPEAPKAAPKAEAPKPAAPPPVVVAAPAPAAVGGAPVPDAPVSALEALQALLALKLKKPVSEVQASQNIKGLVGGKSALQNEILGDLQKEFGGGPDNAAEMPLSELAQKMGGTYSGSGAQSNNLIAKMVADKMPGGFNQAAIKAYLSGERRLGEGRIQGVLLHAITMAPEKRLGSDAEAKAWLDTVVDSYGQKVGQAIPKGGAAPAAAAAAAPVMMAAGPAAQPVPDAPVSPLESLRALLAVKLKKSIGEVQAGQNIKALVGGKSALQNEILGDLQKEFGAGPDNAAELPLSELAQKMGGSYQGLGKQSQAQIAKLLASKMPGGFGMAQARAYLSSERLLGEGRMDGVLMHGLSMEPPARLASEAEAKAWLDQVADSYAQAQGVQVPRASQGGGTVAVAGGGGVAVDSAALKAFEARQERVIRDIMRTYSEFLGESPRAGELKAEMEAELRRKAEEELGLWQAEHGEFYGKAIRPAFDSRKQREYEGHWNLARQDAVDLYNKLATGALKFDDPAVHRTAQLIVNRASKDVLTVVEFHARKARAEGRASLATYFDVLAREVRNNLDKPPVYLDQQPHLMPTLGIKPDGELDYREVPRPGIRTAADYAKEMREGSDYQVEAVPPGPAREALESSVQALRNVVAQLKMQKADPAVVADFEGQLADQEARLTGKKRMPHLFMKKPLENDQNTHVYDPQVTDTYLGALDKMAQEGMSFQGKTYLLVGAGKGSIAVELAKNILAGGGTVVITSLTGSKEENDFYRQVYEQYGAKGSRLVTVPMNAGSLQDTEAMVKYVYDKKDGLGLDLDGIIPFAAIPEQGRDIGNIDSRSEFAHRLMLTNVIRLLGAVKNAKKERGIDTKPAHVILPMSPNHGAFGSDGLYAESKIGLEPLLNKWKSEGWGNYLSIAGAVIGWTRGTGVMAGNNVVAPGMEKLGARTFSQSEMAFNLMGLMHPDMVREAQRRPVWADLNGGFSGIRNLNQASADLRGEITGESSAKKAVAADAKLDQEALGIKPKVERKVAPKADFGLAFPELPSREKLESLKALEGMVDLSKVVVVAGFGEVGPYGGARTRWEMESKGEFSLEGNIELAWMMGLIKYHNGQGKDGKPYTGWVDAKTSEPVADHEVKKKYEEQILGHTGIRLVEPGLFEGYDPHRKMFLREVVLTRDMHPVEVGSKEEADHFKLQHGEKVDVYEKSGQWYIQLKEGATLSVPKALAFNRFVAGQIPTGWDPARYGVPKDIIDQVDPTTLYTLVSTVEALVSAGITDPYEFYQYVHVSEVGNTTGGGMGGMRSIHRSFFERKLEKPVQGDILQEQLINVMPAWINMLLLSSSGPIKTPVGACATAAESVEMGVETIQGGKAKVVFVGGYDDFGEAGSYEFANMQATSNSQAEVAAGRDPKEMSRPTSKTRSGFMEAQGAGVQVLMSADLAIQMGVPVYGIVAMTHTATDEQGRSVPAPGQGILTAAKEKQGGMSSPLLDLEFRRKQLEAERQRIQQWKLEESDKLHSEVGENPDEAGVALFRQRMDFIQQNAARMEKAALALYGQDFYKDDATIAPLRGALAVFGLKPDDIAITSFHGTSTQANDKNESAVVQQQMAHLGRSEGNPLFVVAQKWLTGHPKGAAAAWMFNGLVQSLLTGQVPGNRAQDNVDPALRENKHLLYPNRTIPVEGMKAGLLQSFGFGQAGAQILLIHPDYLFAAVGAEGTAAYAAKRAEREAKATRLWQDGLTARRALMIPKTEAPYTAEERGRVYLDPTARATFYPGVGYRFSPPQDDKKDGGGK